MQRINNQFNLLTFNIMSITKYFCPACDYAVNLPESFLSDDEILKACGCKKEVRLDLHQISKTFGKGKVPSGPRKRKAKKAS